MTVCAAIPLQRAPVGLGMLHWLVERSLRGSQSYLIAQQADLFVLGIKLNSVGIY